MNDITSEIGLLKRQVRDVQSTSSNVQYLMRRLVDGRATIDRPAGLVARAAGVSLESLPIGQFPNSLFLRTTWARRARDKTLDRLFEVGAKAQARMERQYDDEIRRLTWERAGVTGKATETMPRWTHVRGA